MYLRNEFPGDGKDFTAKKSLESSESHDYVQAYGYATKVLSPTILQGSRNNDELLGSRLSSQRALFQLTNRDAF